MEANKLQDCMAAWDIAQDVLHVDLGLDVEADAQSFRSEAYSWLRQRQTATARPCLVAAIDRWEEASNLFRTNGRKWVHHRLEHYLSTVSLQLSEEDKGTIRAELWLKVHNELNGDLDKMRTDLAEVDRGLAEWGEVKPVAIQYREIVNKVWADRLRTLRVLGLVNLFLLVALLVLNLAMWLIVFPVGLCILYFLETVVVEHSEYGRLYFDSDPELQEYARTRGKKS